jgi:hypothetical protein
MVPDPSGIIQLFEEADRRLDEAVDTCLSTWVNQEARKQFHERVHTVVNTLFSAMYNDLGMLQGEIGAHIFSPEDRMPTLSESAALIPKLFGAEDGDVEASQRLAIDRVRWAFTQWMQVQVNLFSMLSGATAVAAASGRSGFKITAGRATDFEEPYVVLGTVGRLKKLTVEYLTYRSELLITYGLPAYGLEVHYGRKPQDFLILAWKAYHRDEPTASHLLHLGIRMALVNLFGLESLPPQYELSKLATHHMLVVAAKAGIAIPMGIEAIGNVLVDLERASARCEPVRESFLLPFLRIGEEFVEKLNLTVPTPVQIASVRRQLGLMEPPQ